MPDIDKKLQRTWVNLLLENKYKEIAAIAVDTEIETQIGWDLLGGTIDDPIQESYVSVIFSLPSSVYSMVINSERIKKVMERAASAICNGYFDEHNNDFRFRYRIKLIEIEEGWQNVIKNLIANASTLNQGVITEKAFARENKQPYTYNEMRFASWSEIQIAKEFEEHKVLFFPLPLAVRVDTGNFYQDHREVDFLICQNGVWGILEVSYHPDRFEKDAEKDAWFKKAGILCIQHYTAEKCHNEPKKVVEEFLEILSKYRK